MIKIKTEFEIDMMRESGKMTKEVLDGLGSAGVSGTDVVTAVMVTLFEIKVL